MQDGIIAGNGNSRYLKTVAAALSLYPTYQDFMAALIAGTFPIDLNGINEAGWSQLGTALNKANLLTDATATAIGLKSSATPNTAINQLNSKINTNNNSVTSKLNALNWAKIGTASLAGLNDGDTFTISLSKSVSNLDALLFDAENLALSYRSGGVLFPEITGKLSGQRLYIAASTRGEVTGGAIVFIDMSAGKKISTILQWKFYRMYGGDISSGLDASESSSFATDLSGLRTTLSGQISPHAAGSPSYTMQSGTITVYGRSNP